MMKILEKSSLEMLKIKNKIKLNLLQKVSPIEGIKEKTEYLCLKTKMKQLEQPNKNKVKILKRYKNSRILMSLLRDMTYELWAQENTILKVQE